MPTRNDPKILVGRRGRFGSVTYSRESVTPGGSGVPVPLHLSASRFVTDSAWVVVGAGPLDVSEYPDRDFRFVVLGWTEEGAKMDVRLFDLTGSATLDTRQIQSNETTETESSPLSLGAGNRVYEVRARMPTGGVGFVAAAFIAAES